MKHSSPEFRRIAENGRILRCQVGSGVHGTNIASQDDRDEMGICIEPPEYVIGLKRFEQWCRDHKVESDGWVRTRQRTWNEAREIVESLDPVIVVPLDPHDLHRQCRQAQVDLQNDYEAHRQQWIDTGDLGALQQMTEDVSGLPEGYFDRKAREARGQTRQEAWANVLINPGTWTMVVVILVGWILALAIVLAVP